jgi:hypothetical protein
MQAWLESVAGPDYATALMWTILALIGLLLVLVAVRVFRGLTFGTFVSGGKNRKTRLAVMDATAVDSQRRLVLVRRDDIEHLILIGGPTDVVVEQNIRMVPRRASHEDSAEMAHAPSPAVSQAAPLPAPAQAAPRPVAQRPVPVPPTPASVPPILAVPPAAARPAAPPSYRPPVEPRFASQESSVAVPRPSVSQPQPAVSPAPRVDVGVERVRAMRPVAPVAPMAPIVGQAVPVSAPSQYRPVSVDPVVRPTASTRPAPDLDDALVEELKEKLDTTDHRLVSDATERSLDEEMDKLLGDLSRGKT